MPWGALRVLGIIGAVIGGYLFQTFGLALVGITIVRAVASRRRPSRLN